MLALTFDRNLQEKDVKSIRSAVQNEAASKGLGPQQGFTLVFVVDELCCNVMEHGKAAWMDLRLEANAAGFRLTLTDNGVPFDTASGALNAAGTDLTLSEDRRMGLNLVGRLVDELRYERTGDGLNRVELTKSF